MTTRKWVYPLVILVQRLSKNMFIFTVKKLSSPKFSTWSISRISWKYKKKTLILLVALLSCFLNYLHFAGQNARRFIHNPNEHVDMCHSGNKKVTTKKRLSDKFSSKTSKSRVLRNAIIFWWELTSSQNQGKLVYSITCCTMDKYSTSIPLMGSTRNTPSDSGRVSIYPQSTMVSISWSLRNLLSRNM